MNFSLLSIAADLYCTVLRSGTVQSLYCAIIIKKNRPAVSKPSWCNRLAARSARALEVSQRAVYSGARSLPYRCVTHSAPVAPVATACTNRNEDSTSS